VGGGSGEASRQGVPASRCTKGRQQEVGQVKRTVAGVVGAAGVT
jgi:hypothetical protein